MSYIELSSISKSYIKKNGADSETVHVLDQIDLSVNKGEFVTFFGPNGCGKTTCLKIIAGLESSDSGNVTIAKQGTEDANIGFIFQNYIESLFPWQTVLGNIAFPLKLKGVSSSQRKKIVTDKLKDLEIDLDIDVYPYQLSGGQQQMVSIARGLIQNPDFILMDEPFSSLDYQTRFEMQRKILDIWNRTKMTILFVSHEIDEAILLADKIAVLSKKPCKILDLIDTGFPETRSHDIMKSDRFVNLKNKILDLFIGEIQAP